MQVTVTEPSSFIIKIEATPEELKILYHLGNWSSAVAKVLKKHEPYACKDVTKMDNIIAEFFHGIKEHIS